MSQPGFNKLMTEVKAKFNRLCRSAPFTLETFPRHLPKSGIYVMQEKGRFLYVGRSNRIRGRLKKHVTPKHNSASFAFLMAREATGKKKAAYNAKGSRDELLKDPSFKSEFHSAIARIRKMKVLVIEEENQMKQAILEIYASYCLETPYNDFKTH